MPETTATTIDLSGILAGLPSGAWAGISSDLMHVVSYGAEMAKVLDEARDKGEGNPVMVRVPEREGPLIL
jgi:hypothetical protein